MTKGSHNQQQQKQWIVIGNCDVNHKTNVDYIIDD